jgi:transcriptional regulator with XRE-family HTH domain
MAHPSEGLSEKIKGFRKSMQMSLHDCARLLGTSTGRYLAFEQGEESLSLPEIEILAYYFGIPLMECLEGQINPSMRFSLLEEDKRTAYIHLREKWIHSRIALETENKGMEVGDLVESLGISEERLEEYKSGKLPIPLDHLQKICMQFDIPLDDFFPELEISELENKQSFKQAVGQWNPEFPQGDSAGGSNEITYHQLLAALKEIPEADQAQIAKIILDKLKSK